MHRPNPNFSIVLFFISFFFVSSAKSQVVITLINQVQGAGAMSPMVGNTVTLEAIVVGDFQDNGMGTNGDLDGFFIQEEDLDADANPLTSEGIFIYDGVVPATNVNIGDRIRITGEVQEFNGLTELSNVTELVILSTGNTLPSASNVALPSVNIITNADGKYKGDLEQYEGMLITISNTMTITEMFNLDRFGEMLLTAGDRLYQFTFNNMPDPTGYDLHLQNIARKTLMLDDGLNTQNPDPIIYPDGNLGTDDELRMGNQVSSLTGVLNFSRGAGSSGELTYRLHPTSPPVFDNSNPRPSSPPDVGGTLQIASLNILNFFTTLANGPDVCGPLEDQSCRGASSMMEYDRQLQKLTTVLAGLDVDILGLVELENNVNADPAMDGTDPVLEAIVDALNAEVGAGTYDFIDAGIIGIDAIKVGIIYKPAVVIPDAETSIAILDDSQLVGLGFGSYAPLFDGLNRNSLAVTFEQVSDGEKITLVVNHLKSKSASGAICPDPNCDNLDGAGGHNQTRTRAIEVLNAWLATDPTGSNDPDYLLIGDFNSYSQEEPIKLLQSLGYTEMIKMMTNDPDAYSYVFDGQAAMLDYAFASPSLTGQVIDAAEWHVNADEADAIDYNLDFGRNPAIFDGSAIARISDHDPVIIGLVLYMAPIPTMTQWGICILVLLIVIIGIVFLRISVRKSVYKSET